MEKHHGSTTCPVSENRIQRLMDSGTFTPFQPEEHAGFLLGSGTAGGRRLYVLAVDVDNPLRRSPFDAIARVCRFLAYIKDHPAPLVQLLDTPAELRTAQGTFVPPGALKLLAHDQGMGRLYAGLAALEGVVPRAAVLFGTLGASRSFPAVLSDATVMLEEAVLCLGRPDAVRLMTGQRTDFHRLGGAGMHAVSSGTAHAMAHSEQDALTWVRNWLGHLPNKAGTPLPRQKPLPPRRALSEAVQGLERGLNTPFDAHGLLEALADAESWVEMGRLHAGECVTGFCRFEGLSAGVVANNAAVRGGILHPETCRKMTRFIRLCSFFGVPLVFLADTPGFMVGEAVERGGMVQAAGDLFTAIAHCTTPKVCVVVRKAYSAGLYAMAGPGFDGELWAMPGASISIFGPEALRRLEPGQRDSGLGGESFDEILAGAVDPQVLVDQGLVHEIIPWEALRHRLAIFAGKADGRMQEHGDSPEGIRREERG